MQSLEAGFLLQFAKQSHRAVNSLNLTQSLAAGMDPSSLDKPHGLRGAPRQHPLLKRQDHSKLVASCLTPIMCLATCGGCPNWD